MGHIEGFITGTRRTGDSERVLSTVLFTDIVGSTNRLAEVGDKMWRQMMEVHDEFIRSNVGAFAGRVCRTTGDGALALFDGPGRALQCAFMLRDQLRDQGLQIRVGVHTGEVELRPDGEVAGMAVHLAARVVSEARPEEVLVSRTVKDLVTGDRFAFTSRGRHTLKGVPEEWELFATDEISLVTPC